MDENQKCMVLGCGMAAEELVANDACCSSPEYKEMWACRWHRSNPFGTALVPDIPISTAKEEDAVSGIKITLGPHDYGYWLNVVHELRRGHGLFNQLADEIEARLPVPKPAEPQGLGAVVEVEPMFPTEDRDRDFAVTRLVRMDDGLWWAHGGNGGWYWQDVKAVRVLSKGILV